MRILGIFLILVLAWTAAGCGKKAPPTPGADRQPTFVEPSCPKQLTGGLDENGKPFARSDLPTDFVIDWVFRCREETRTIPGNGVVFVSVAERSDSPAEELLAELRRPSDPATGGACPLVLVTPPYFLLVDKAGKAILPAVPTNSCGQPREDTDRLLNAMTFHVLSETEVRQGQSQKSIDTGCADSWKDEITLEADQARPAPATPLWSAPVTSLRICGYELTDEATEPVGTLRTGRVLDGDAATNLVTALDLAGPADACTVPHTRFAVLSNPASGDWAVAELDGCHRLLRPDRTLGQLDAATGASLTG